MSRVVFLGGGRITSAMLAGMRLGRTKHTLVVHDRNPAKLRDLKKNYAAKVEPILAAAVEQADILIVAVRPGSVAELLYAVGKLSRPLRAVSLAAGVPLRDLKRMSGRPTQWARAMPSPACRNGHGLTGITFPRTCSLADRKLVRELFQPLVKSLKFGKGNLTPSRLPILAATAITRWRRWRMLGKAAALIGRPHS